MRSFSKMPVEEIIKNNLAPHMVRFGISTNCNFNCTMCCGIHSPLRDFEKKKININIKSFQKTIDYLKKSGTKSLVFSGVGEPFFHPQIYDILSYISQDFILVIQTNLSLASIEKFKKLNFKKQVIFSVNFNGVSENAYKAIYGNQDFSTLNLVLKKACALHKLENVYIRLIFIVSNLNKQDVVKVMKLADTFGFDLHLEFSNEFTDGASMLNLTLGEKIRISHFAKKYLETRNSKAKNIINTEEFFIQGKGNRTGLENISYCNAPHLYVRVEEDGRVFTCNNISDSYCMGNINNESFENIWNSDRYKTIRKKTHTGELLDTCCHNNNQASGGNYKIRCFINQ